MCEYSESEGNDIFTKWAFLKEIMVMVLKAKREGGKVAIFPLPLHNDARHT